ncbi:hypothetical protein [Curtobacterium sp. L1-20]|uniref:hypothetical protein n=1 Tax=Curtobacterium sp. L1-20 TaxID=3138181 RepID=UPI003B524CD3
MAEQQHFTGIHRQSDGRVPELVARLDDERSVALDGYRVEDGERVFRDTKGNHSFWYDSKNWSAERIALKDRTEIQGTVDQVRRQVTAIDRLGGGRLEYIVTDERFARLLDDAVDRANIDWDVDVDIFYRPMERRRSPW